MLVEEEQAGTSQLESAYLHAPPLPQKVGIQVRLFLPIAAPPWLTFLISANAIALARLHFKFFPYHHLALLAGDGP
jgi:hypothetical protein